ncbi:hypothetical protein T492DRAFT_895537 [Pavlovales sp. CCMP2436]|nr:hypothetical protein T492DRAFT_895537 [Pavlovales sp. CCMP2436]
MGTTMAVASRAGDKPAAAGAAEAVVFLESELLLLLLLLPLAAAADDGGGEAYVLRTADAFEERRVPTSAEKLHSA